MPVATNYPDLKLFIGGEWVGGEGRVQQPVLNPATEEVLGQLPHASKADLDRALEAAQRSFPVWRAKPPHERGKILRRAAELLRERTETIARIATWKKARYFPRRAGKSRSLPRSSSGTRKRDDARTGACCRREPRAYE